jgi:hypothetical protein
MAEGSEIGFLAGTAELASVVVFTSDPSFGPFPIGSLLPTVMPLARLAPLAKMSASSRAPLTSQIMANFPGPTHDSQLKTRELLDRDGRGTLSSFPLLRSLRSTG